MDIIGKKAQKEYFDTVIRGKNLGHFYILEGARGVGKKTLTDYIAASIHCESANAPCGVCSSCLKHRSGNHPDYIEIKNDDPDKKTVTVETIRKYAKDIYTKPLLADTKVYVLTDRIPLGREGQNAFLKVLEEPPSYAVIIILVNNSDVLLPTVKSRGNICHINNCTKDETIYFILKNCPKAADKAEIIASFSQGNLGAALSLAVESEFFIQRRELFDLLTYINKGKRSGLCEVVSYFSGHKDSVQTLLELLISWLRDALYIKTTGSSNIINKDYSELLSGFAFSVTTVKIIKTLEAAQEMAAKFSKGNNTEIWAADLMMKLG